MRDAFPEKFSQFSNFMVNSAYSTSLEKPHLLRGGGGIKTCFRNVLSEETIPYLGGLVNQITIYCSLMVYKTIRKLITESEFCFFQLEQGNRNN